MNNKRHSYPELNLPGKSFSLISIFVNNQKFILFCRLSGESPFLGESEADTFNRITKARWEFSDVFDYVSNEAKDFIKRLLLKEPKYVLEWFFCLKLLSICLRFENGGLCFHFCNDLHLLLKKRKLLERAFLHSCSEFAKF